MGQMDEGKILCGPPAPDLSTVTCSFPEYLLGRWKSLPEDKILLIDGQDGRTFTVRELLTLSVQAGRGWRDIGLDEGDRVLFFSKTSSNLVVAAYGVMLVGGVVAPLDTNLKLHELRHMYQLIQPKFIFFEKEDYELIDAATDVLQSKPKYIISNMSEDENRNVSYITLIERDGDIDSFVPAQTVDVEDTIAIISSSSGTTGLPKGVAVSQKNLIFQMLSFHDVENPPFLQITQFFWATAWTFWLISVVNGTTRVLLRQFDPAKFCQVVEKYKSAFTIITPADLTSLISYPDLHKYDLSSMINLSSTGTALSAGLKELVEKTWKTPVKVQQGFGTTEMTGYVTKNPGIKKPTSIGLLAPGLKLKVIDPDTGDILGVNQPGELCFTSLGVMMGYLNSPEATKAAVDEDGYYHTGDLGYYDEEGYIFITDRIKEIFKFRGVHISPVDMEMVIEQIPAVKEVAVCGVPHPVDVNRPTAIVVKREGYNLTEQQIVRHVANTMAESKRLAGGVIFVDQIPRTTNSKIKRRELRKIVEDALK